ncbi:hypothetical protein B0H14DRAFT_3757961, partial [Mycena olivaceomarginata]
VSTRPVDAPKSRPPNTIVELLALYERVPLKSLRDDEVFEACEMAIAADSVDQSRAVAALPDSTDESLEQLRTDIQEQLTILPRPADSVLILTDGNQLKHDVLVAERMSHQTKSTAKAVRQHGHTITKTTGVDRYVRHAGSYGGSGAPPNACAQNKATVQNVAASKFVAHRGHAFAKFQWVHENMHLANISQINPLQPGHFFVGLKPGASGGVVLCKVLTIYTKSTMHDWIPAATSVGTPSYVYADVYQPLSGRMFSSLSCQSLACGTTLQFPRTHIIFSLASFTPTISRQEVPTVDGHPHTLVTLCAKSYELFETLRANQSALYIAVEELTRMAKSKDVDPALPSEGAVLLEDAAFTWYRIWGLLCLERKMAYPIPMRTDFGQKVRYGNAQILGIRIGHQTAYAMGLAVGAVVTVTVTARVFVPVGAWELGWSGDTAVALGEVFGGCRTGTSNGA